MTPSTQLPVAVSIDGVVTSPDTAAISVFDRGLWYGDGLFEVLRTYGGAAPDLPAHLDRLYASATALAMRVLARDQLAAAIARTIGAAAPGDHRVRVIVTRGPGALAARLAELGPGRAIVIVEPLLPQPETLALAVVDWPLPRRTGPTHKTLAYLDHVLARELAVAAGADEAVRLDADGAIAECATSNLFVVVAGEVATSPLATGALPGITRDRVIACCASLGIAARERRITLDELRAADEIFVTSALRGVVSVVRLDGEGRAHGPMTARIAAAHAQVIRALLY